MNQWTERLLENAQDYKFQHVFIDKEKVRATAKNWAKKVFKTPSWRELPNYPFDDDNLIQFICITSAIDFCFHSPGTSKKFWTKWRGQKWTGSYAMSACVTRATEEGIDVLDANFLENISMRRMEAIFNKDSEMPLLSERCAIWQDAGYILQHFYDGHFKNLFEESGYRCFNEGAGICERLAYRFSRAFYDGRSLKKNGENIPLFFHKKAFLVPLIYYGRAKDSKTLPQIKDTSSLGPLIDYQIPRALRHFGMLAYSKELAKKISKREELPMNSIFEVEIRLASAVVFCMILEMIENLTAPQLDYFLWTYAKKIKTPAHITMCVNY